jgi:aldehyde dehydrogenase (NAD+)
LYSSRLFVCSLFNKEELLKRISESIDNMYGKNIQENRFYPRIVNERAFNRLTSLFEQGSIIKGGKTDAKDKFIAPTIIDNVSKDDLIMQGEIFGPILPVMSFDDINEPIEFINKNEKPLAFYYFGKN